MERALAVFDQNLAHYVETSAARVIAAKIPLYMSFPPEALRASIGRVFAALRRDLEAGTPEACPALVSALGASRAARGTSLGDMLRGIMIGFDTVSEHFAQVFGADVEPVLWWEKSRGTIAYTAAVSLADTFLKAREDFIREAGASLQKLSAPVVPLYAGVLLLPLVGAVDRERAEQITSTLLEHISRHRSSAILIDITGVANMDAEIASHLTRMTAAGRLLGAEVILVGINPDVARVMAQAGVDLGGAKVLGDLHSGLEHALKLQGKAIRDL